MNQQVEKAPIKLALQDYEQYASAYCGATGGDASFADRGRTLKYITNYLGAIRVKTMKTT